MAETVSAAKTRIREAAAAASARGLDAAVADIESGLVTIWTLERQGKIAAHDVPSIVGGIASALKKIAPPPPKKVKFSDPIRKILPLSEASVRPALDAAMLLMALTQVGDFTEQTDKARQNFELFLDDWRRMTWESARISDWGRFRALATTEERALEGRLSRDAALQVLEAIQKRRADKITTVPDLSMLACARCGQFRGRDRVRCTQCKGTYCTRCSARTSELCLADYSQRYAGIDLDRRRKLAADARSVLKAYKLDEYVRNDAFVRALREEGVDVVFLESAPAEGEEAEASQGRRRLLMRDREGPTSKRILFRALARCYFRARGEAAEPLLEELFVDFCLGLPVEEALRPAP